MRTLIEVLASLPIIFGFLIICTVIIRLIYMPVIGNNDSLLLSFISLVVVVFAFGYYGYWVEINGYGNGTSAHGYFLAFIAIPFTTGWIGNFLLDLLKYYGKNRK